MNLNFPLVRNLCVLLLVASLTLSPPTSQADVGTDIKTQATSLYNTLNPINIALGPLIDRAAQDGDAVLQQRLEQLHGILQEALSTLDEIAKKRIEQLNQDVKNRLDQLQAATGQAIDQLNALAEGRISQIDDALEARIDQLGSAAGNVVASLPIPIEPIMNVGTRGITIYKNTGDFTTVFITGSGLRKNDTTPDVWLETNPGAESSWFSFNRPGETKVTVASASMSLLQIRIPNSLIPTSSKALDYALRFRLRRGNSYLVLPSYTEPSIPLHICGGLPTYEVEITQTASGQYWDRRTIPVPGSGPTKGYNYGFYVDSGSKNLDVCAVASEGYEVDTDPYPGYNGGITLGKEGGDHYHNIKARPGCFHLYADDRDGGANEWIAEVFERQRKLAPTVQCADPVRSTKALVYGSNTTVL